MKHSQLGSQTTSMLAWHAAWLRKSKAWPACLPRTRLVTQPWEWKSWKSLVLKKKKTRPGNWVWGLSCSTATLLTVAPGPLRSSSWSLPWRWRTPMLFSWTEGITKCWRPIWSTALQEKQEPSTTWISSTSSLSPSEIFLCFTWSTMKSWWCMPVSQVPGLVCGCQVRRMIQRMPYRWTPEPRPWAEIASVDRYTELTPNSYKEAVDSAPRTEEKWETDSRMIIDFLWSDPRGGAGYGPSYRKSRGVFMFGPDVTAQFCRENNISLVIRSHEVKAEGWLKDHDTLMSVFSAPNYLDTGGNKGAFLTLTPGPNGKLQAGWCLYVKYYNVYVFNCMNMMNNYNIHMVYIIYIYIYIYINTYNYIYIIIHIIYIYTVHIVDNYRYIAARRFISWFISLIHLD